MESQSSTSHDLSIPFRTLEPADRSSDEIDETSALKFYEIIPTLQDMASFTVAIESWSQFIINENLDREGFYDIADGFHLLEEKDEKKVKVMLGRLPLPRSILRQVEKCVGPVRVKMNEWAQFYLGAVFRSERKIKISDLVFCHWLPNGEIDYERSARNMLSNPRITLTNRFEIMCKYCFEDDIKKFPIDSIPRIFGDTAFSVLPFFNQDPITTYWVCYLKNELDRLPIENVERVEARMITAWRLNNWSVVEYFWDRLNADEQTFKLENLLERYFHLQKKIFSKMNGSQKTYIISKIPIKVMENFWIQQGQERFALQTWICIRNFIDYEQFKQMWKVLAAGSMSNTHEKLRYLLDIWNHCPDHLKKLAFQPVILGEIMKFYRASNFQPDRCRDIEFLIDYLSYASPILRKKFIFQRADIIVLNFELSLTDQLIGLCLSNPEDVAEFKKQVLESEFIRKHLCCALRDNDVQNLNQFLDYFCPDSNTRSEFCCNILQILPVNFTTVREEKKLIKVVIEFIDENLLLTLPYHALQLKKKIVLRECFCWGFLSEEDEMAKMIQLVSEVLDGDELRVFKSKALEEVQNRFKWYRFDENTIGWFVSWCCNSDRRQVTEFKKTLSIDDIFEDVWKVIKSSGILKENVDRRTMQKVFEPLDKCLLWYFENADDVKRFKLKKVFGCCNERTSRFLLYYNDEKNDVFARNTLPWFFDGDRSAIEFFKNIYKNEYVGRMI